MKEQYTAYPTNWVSKNDLLLARPDLAEQIQNLSDANMHTIAKMIGDAAAETHNVAIEELLASYFQGNEKV
jgi:hypothetical protein